MRGLILAGMALLTPALTLPVFAQQETGSDFSQDVIAPLFPEEVLESAATRFPDILESLAFEAAARGDQLAAEGAFDLVFNADGFDRVTGFWTGAILNTELRQNLRPLGAQVYGGYRVSDGEFPIYEDINFTNTGGEFKIGALFSLLRNRSIDERRFRVEDARLATAQASLEVTLTQVGVQQQVLNAYWRWVATGNELQIYRDLLTIAQDRAAGLEEQVRRGAQPDIAVTENLQNIIRREILVTEAERNFTVASNALSFFLRDVSGNLVVPGLERLPKSDQLEALNALSVIVDADESFVLASRPELRSLRVAMERARNKVRLGENDLKPDLDLNFEVSTDVGAIAEGLESRDSTDTIIGFRFSVPLQRRDARGRLQRAEAELRAAQLRERRTEDQITVELGNILANLDAALRLAELATGEVSQAEKMVDAERQRFNLGASDFFLVNVREERAADARIRATRAELNGRLAEASYNAATMNLEKLGL
ncbi:MAG: TolC family protein [Pseudomonadota bacterium]